MVSSKFAWKNSRLAYMKNILVCLRVLTKVLMSNKVTHKVFSMIRGTQVVRKHTSFLEEFSDQRLYLDIGQISTAESSDQ